MNPEIEKIKRQIEDLNRRMDALGDNSKIPLEVGEAFKARILSDAGLAALSVKGSTTENRAVNEAGVASYSVLGIPDGFLQVELLGIVYYVPYYL